MQDPAARLYGYIAEARYAKLLSMEEYRTAAAAVQAAEDALLVSLSREQAALLRTYAEALAAQSGLEQLHLVREALGLAAYFSSTTIT